MSSLRSFSANKAIFVARLLKTWEMVPELSFSELLSQSSSTRFDRMTDVEFVEALERWAMLRQTQDPPGSRK